MEPCKNPVVVSTLAFGLATGAGMMSLSPQVGGFLVSLLVVYLVGKVVISQVDTKSLVGHGPRD
jgi:hypothetical protein